ncbi:sugar transferase [Sphingomonas sp.]|jgi:lipopolysaccharide/colanic/teichoic acid biosynthesis glycosyltransferase|uniref:sugar transferase n=1 Tax=Sphingomonas sp. TaxID=28214 RepID=UPI00262C6C4F|nr:sugar transferase [Sphingomonas sp.]MDF2496168.1 polyprenyl glycosylphosphotransferase [Sphingomonas sp.]
MQEKTVVKRSWLDLKSMQIAVAVLALIIQYFVVLLIASEAARSIQLIFNTFLGCIIATLVGVFFVRGISQYPGVEASAYIVPSFIVAYAALLAAFILGRLEYSRILLTTSFISNIVLFFTIFSIAGRRRRLRIGIVPEGSYIPSLQIDGIEWFMMRDSSEDVSHLDAIAVDLRADISDDWDRRLADFALSNVPVYHSKHLLESLTGKVELEHLSENNFGTLSPLRSYMSVKHVVDVLAALVALIVLLPLLAAIALIIRLDSPGPVLFRQVRIGYQGRPFRVFKFRTMTAAPVTAPNALDAAKTKDGDKRVTRPGGFLRQSRLDELPQLLNVIKGEMSWIGPRPEAEVLSRWYAEEIPFYPYRHIVRPGITGWAQVNQGHVAEVEEVKSKLHYDFYYIKHFSPWIDLLIVARTIRTMLTGFGAK